VAARERTRGVEVGVLRDNHVLVASGVRPDLTIAGLLETAGSHMSAARKGVEVAEEQA
jgi:hypothetical protein